MRTKLIVYANNQSGEFNYLLEDESDIEHIDLDDERYWCFAEGDDVGKIEL